MRLSFTFRTLLVLGLCVELHGQDLHYSQFFAAPMDVNPGLTGIFNGDLRFSGNYRAQWHSVPVNYTTFTGAVDKKFLRYNRRDFFSAGLLFNYDQAGDSKLRMGQLGLTGSYTFELKTNNFLSLGVQTVFSQRGFSMTDLTFDDQYDGSRFDPNLPHGESFNRTSRFIFDINAGFNYRWQKSSRTKIDLGAGLFHINNPRIAFYEGDNYKMPLRLSLQALGSFRTGKFLDVLLRGFYQDHGPFNETVLGVAGLLHISEKKGRELGLELGVNFRLKDAWIPMVRFHGRSWEAGVSYDYNHSPFRVATLKRGGPEFSFIYILSKVKPLNKYKVCPIY